jgi:predicted DNA-binding mobile mystery protein A
MEVQNTIRALRRHQLDKQLSKYKNMPKFKLGNIREIRDALGMTSAQLAGRIGVAQSGVSKMEKSELEKSISLKTLERAAEALGCELAYVFVPRVSLEQAVLNQAHKRITALSENLFRHMAIELQEPDEEQREQFLADFADELIKNGNELWK